MNSNKSDIIEALSAIEKISGKIHKIAVELQELENSLYTIQKKIYLKAVEPQKERKNERIYKS